MGKPITVREAAYLADKSPRTIYYWIEKGVLGYTSRHIDSDELFKAEAIMAQRIGRPRKNHSNVAQRG